MVFGGDRAVDGAGSRDAARPAPRGEAEMACDPMFVSTGLWQRVPQLTSFILSAGEALLSSLKPWI